MKRFLVRTPIHIDRVEYIEHVVSTTGETKAIDAGRALVFEEAEKRRLSGREGERVWIGSTTVQELKED